MIARLVMLFNRLQDGNTEKSKLRWKDEILPQSKELQRATRKKNRPESGI